MRRHLSNRFSVPRSWKQRLWRMRNHPTLLMHSMTHHGTARMSGTTGAGSHGHLHSVLIKSSLENHISISQTVTTSEIPQTEPTHSHLSSSTPSLPLSIHRRPTPYQAMFFIHRRGQPWVSYPARIINNHQGEARHLRRPDRYMSVNGFSYDVGTYIIVETAKHKLS